MNTYDQLMAMPHVQPNDLSATNGGVRHDLPLRTKAELARARAFDAWSTSGELAELERSFADYQRRLLAKDTHKRTLGPIDREKHLEEMTKNRAPGGVQNANVRTRRKRSVADRLLQVLGGRW